jgi:uncharacterized protein (TIGR02266 family)
MIICRACQQQLPGDARYCGFCGFRVGPLQMPSPEPEVTYLQPEPALVGASEPESGDVAFAKTIRASRQDLERMHSENRVARRYPMRVDLTYSSAHNFYTGLTENISTGGLFVVTDEPAEAGELLLVQLTIPGFEIPWTALCEVRWVHGESGPTGQPGMGLRFVDLDPALEAVIDAFIAHREPILSED